VWGEPLDGGSVRANRTENRPMHHGSWLANLCQLELHVRAARPTAHGERYSPLDDRKRGVVHVCAMGVSCTRWWCLRYPIVLNARLSRLHFVAENGALFLVRLHMCHTPTTSTRVHARHTATCTRLAAAHVGRVQRDRAPCMHELWWPRMHGSQRKCSQRMGSRSTAVLLQISSDESCSSNPTTTPIVWRGPHAHASVRASVLHLRARAHAFSSSAGSLWAVGVASSRLCRVAVKVLAVGVCARFFCGQVMWLICGGHIAHVRTHDTLCDPCSCRSFSFWHVCCRCKPARPRSSAAPDARCWREFPGAAVTPSLAKP
jgi:hypothetical protein